MRLLFLDTKPNNPNRYISRAVFSALRRQPGVTEAVWVSYADALKVGLDGRFDAFVAFDGEEAANAVVERLCAAIPRRAIWFTEDPYEFYRNTEVAALFDIVFSNDAGTACRYVRAASHLPLAADRDSHFIPVSSAAPRHHVFFAGTAWPNRLEFLRELKTRHPGLRTKLILVSNPAIAPYIESYRSEFEFSSGVSIRDFCRLANASLLTLALPRSFSLDPQNTHLASDTPGPRLFEAALAGSCQLVDARTTPLAAELFDPQHHFLSYRSMDECLAQIGLAADNEDRVRSMARAAQEHALRNHLYDERAARILSALNEIQPAAERTAPSGRKRRVLFVSHNLVRFGHFGGAEVYLDRTRRALRNLEPWVLAPNQRRQDGKYLLFSPDEQVAEEFQLSNPITLGDLVSPEFDYQFQRLLGEYGFDVVHINHFDKFAFSFVHFARAYGCKIVFTLHDYHSICENFNLIGMEGKYCRIPERPPQTCDVCLAATRGFAPGSQARRRRFLREAFDKIDCVLVESASSAAIFGDMFPHMRGRLLELPPPMILPQAGARAGVSNGLLNVALLGNFSVVKGSETALQVFELARGRPIAFHIFGRVDDELAGDLAPFLDAGVRIHGTFAPGTFPPALASCDVALVLSPWPETYCMTLTECQALGLVPIVTALGAQAERVQHGENGFHVPVADADAILAILDMLIRQPELLARLKQRQSAAASVQIGDFTSRLETIYDRLLAGRSAAAPAEHIRRTFNLGELGVTVSSPRWFDHPPVPAVPQSEPAPEVALVDSAAQALLPEPVTTSVSAVDEALLRQNRAVRFAVWFLLSERRSRFLTGAVTRKAKGAARAGGELSRSFGRLFKWLT